MSIKAFQFPPFDEWKNSFDGWPNPSEGFKQTIGAYTCVIDLFASGVNGNQINTYKAAIAASSNPLNIYTKTIFLESFQSNRSDSEGLKKWYEDVTKQLNEEWKRFIAETYFN